MGSKGAAQVLGMEGEGRENREGHRIYGRGKEGKIEMGAEFM